VAVRILLIDDDVGAIKAIQPGLAWEGYVVDHALPGRNAIRQILVDKPDLVILGIDTRDAQWRFCRRLLTFLDAPLLLLLDSEERMDRARGLDLGADGCMFKPVLVPELLAQVRALLRVEMPPALRRQRSFFVDGDLVVDLTRHEVRRNDEPVALTPTEFRLLSCLVRHAGQLISHQRLCQEVWGPGQWDRQGSIKQYIHHLRKKLEPDPEHPQRIVTRWGEGYTLHRLDKPWAGEGPG
jgi:two-component system KDP operon response regulator KdpE